MRRAAIVLAVLSIFGMAASASAAPILSTAGVMVSYLGGPESAAVAITPHSAWQDPALLGTGAKWISYANTGIGGSVTAPYRGSTINPDGQRVIMSVTETFLADFLSIRFWADDTARITLDGVEVKEPNFTDNTCADGPIGCQPTESFLLERTWDTATTHTLFIEVFQYGTVQNDPNSNPFGLLYSGHASVPEPNSMLLLGVGLFGLAAAARRRVRR